MLIVGQAAMQCYIKICWIATVLKSIGYKNKVWSLFISLEREIKKFQKHAREECIKKSWEPLI